MSIEARDGRRMNTHTPGPWSRDGHTQMAVDCRVADANGAVVAYARGEANARLIAAAPEMFDALRGIVVAWAENQDEHEFHNAMESVIEQVRDAIAKAEDA